MESSLIDNSLQFLKAEKTILYPTDTIWGIGCDATCKDAIEKIYTIKERDHNKSMLVLATEDMLSPTLPREARDLLLNSSRPTTVILPKEMISAAIATNLPAQDGTVGIRIPKFDFCQKLLHNLGHPIVSTSANFSGKPSPITYEEIEEELKMRIDYCLPNLPAFVHDEQRNSRIVKYTKDSGIVILRD